MEVFKFIKCRHAGYFQDMFEISKVNRGRDNQHKLVIKQSRTRLRQSFFARRVVGYWNRSSKDIVSDRYTDTAVLQNATGQVHWERSSLQIFMGLDHKRERPHCPL